MKTARKLSALDATLLVMGGIMGIGIFFNPASVAERAREPWAFLLVWVLGGAVACCAAFTFAELGATFPRSGGWFVFLREAFGPFPAFLFAWVVLFVVSTGALAAIAKFCALAVHGALPGWVGEAGSASSHAVALGLLSFWTCVTLLGVKSGALLQNACMVAKLLAVVALVLAGLVFAGTSTEPGGAGDPTPAALAAVTSGGSSERGSLLAGILAALLPVFFSYGGWQLVCYIAPELREPERALPRAILCGVLGVIVVYLLLNVSFLRVLGLEGIAGHDDFAARYARASLGPVGERWLSAGMAVSAFGIMGVNVMTTPWMYVAMSREGLFFQRFGRLSRRGAPAAALGIQALIVSLYYVRELSDLVDSVVLVEWIFHGLVALALLSLRKKRPELPRPFRSLAYPLAPVVYGLAAMVIVVSNLWQKPGDFLMGLGIVLAGAPVYRLWRRWPTR